MKISKQEVLKLWKPELQASGFRFHKAMFWYGATGCLQLNISIQSNLHRPAWKINATIVIRSPFRKDAEPEVLLMANLRPDGIHCHVTQSSWWATEDLPSAFVLLKQHAIPWFERYGNPDYLAQIVQSAVLERKSLIDIVEPLDNAVTSPPWTTSPSSPAPAPNPSRLFYFLSLLHHASGNREKAIERTEDWLNSLAENDIAARENACQQLSLLRQNARSTSAH